MQEQPSTWLPAWSTVAPAPYSWGRYWRRSLPCRTALLMLWPHTFSGERVNVVVAHLARWERVSVVVAHFVKWERVTVVVEHFVRWERVSVVVAHFVKLERVSVVVAHLVRWERVIVVVAHFVRWERVSVVVAHLVRWERVSVVVAHFVRWERVSVVVAHFVKWERVSVVVEHFAWLWTAQEPEGKVCSVAQCWWCSCWTLCLGVKCSGPWWKSVYCCKMLVMLHTLPDYELLRSLMEKYVLLPNVGDVVVVQFAWLWTAQAPDGKVLSLPMNCSGPWWKSMYRCPMLVMLLLHTLSGEKLCPLIFFAIADFIMMNLNCVLLKEKWRGGCWFTCSIQSAFIWLSKVLPVPKDIALCMLKGVVAVIAKMVECNWFMDSS